MVNEVIGDTFSAASFSPDGGVNVHRRRSRSSTLAVFVHGFGGKGYSTWGDFPRFIFEAGFDSAVFDYPTARERFGRLKTPTPRDSARLLSQEIRDVGEAYEDIFLFGHSMGGLVAALAALDYFRSVPVSAQRVVTPLAGLLAFASPLGGTASWVVPFSADLRFLAWGNRNLQDFRSFVAENIDPEISELPNSNRVSFPIASLSAMSDVWVRRTNSSLGVPVRASEDCGGTHKELVKPPSAQHKSVRWAVKSIADVRRMRRRAIQGDTAAARGPISPEFEPGVVVAKLTDRSEPEWVEAFTKALEMTAELSSLRVVDARDASGSLRPSLVVHPVRAGEVTTEPARSRPEVIEQVRSHAEAANSQVAIGPTGEDYISATASVREWLRAANLHREAWVDGSQDVEGFREKVESWLRVVVQAHLHTASSLPARRRGDALGQALDPADSTLL